ncbi:hypothetical protein MMC26_005960 [Xylographa opegraphella]|nr:hypothetical protein [Xylographa opegraphella]
MEATFVCIWALMAAFALAATQIALSSLAPQNYGDGRLGAVASESKICSQIGIDLLKSGGNAADALVGTVACVGVIGMYHSGIGGGGFMLVRSSSGSYEVIDFREAAPAAAHQEMYSGNPLGSIFGGLASGVPGELRGLEHLHSKYGILSWSTVLDPAIRVARYGFPVSQDLIKYMDFATRDYDFLTFDPTWAIDFAPNGTRLGLGDIMTRRRYADTLETIAEHGVDVFYTGAMANATIRAVNGANGSMTLEDLKEYRAVPRSAAEIDYRGYRVVGCGAPASGAVVLSVLKTVDGYEGFGHTEMLNLSTHRLDEAVRFGYAERASLGDPDFVENIQSYQDGMLNESSAAFKRSKISDYHTLNISDYDPSGFEILETHGTSQVVAADSSGMAISLTSTINLIFGSQVMVPETGVIMNDEMNDFSIPGRSTEFGFLPSPSNYIRPRKRPLSSITPTIVEHLSNNSLYYVVGAAGGSRIITSTIQNLWHVLDHNMSTAQGLAQARFHDQLIPNVIGFEWGQEDVNKTMSTRAESGIGTGKVEGYDNATVAFMRGRNHTVLWVPPGYSSAQAARLLWNGTWEAAGEPRQHDSGGFVI